MFQVSPVFKANWNSTKNIIVNQGGTSSGKTYSILQVLFTLAAQFCPSKADPDCVITVAGQDIPNLKVGALRDAENIYNKTPELKKLIRFYNRSDRIFYFHNGAIIEFKSYANYQDAKSGKRQYLFVNEANGIAYEVYRELAVRTYKKIFIDYNPNAEFWVHEVVLKACEKDANGNPTTEKTAQLIISDHRHNPFLLDKTRQDIEAYKEIDIELWRVYARGLTGKIEGLVLRNWHKCPAIPPGAKLVAYGLDFGFTNDETGLVEVFLQDGELWVNELIYERGLTNADISARLRSLGVSTNKEIICDSAEPKSIEELRRLGWHALPAAKGPDSIQNGIDILKRYTINVTEGSTNLIKELGKYVYKKDRITLKTGNQPIDQFNHLIDPLRYVALNKLRVNHQGQGQTRLPYRPAGAQSDLPEGFL